MRSSMLTCVRLEVVGQPLDGVGAADRIHGVGDSRLTRDDLLRPERDTRRLLGRQRQRLVAAVAVQRLRAAEHRRQRLDGDADDVVVGLLSRERAAGRLRVKAQLLGARVGGAEALAHQIAPRGAVLPGTWRFPRENRCAR